MARKYFSGFETGDFSEWVTDFGAIGVQTSIVRNGVYSCSVAGGSTGLKQSPAGLNLPTAYQRTYFYVDGDVNTLNADGRILFVNGSIRQHLHLRLQIGGACDVYTGNSGSVVFIGTTSNAILSSQWNLIETKVVVGTSGTWEVKINGVVGFTTTVDNTPSGNVDNYEIGCYAVTPGHDVYFDDFCVDDAVYPGPGYIIARQGEPGTPTSNAWTKVGGATIDQVWSATPVSTTESANSGSVTAAIAQTMLTYSFSQTVPAGNFVAGHGPGHIIPNDTINAVKIGCIAKIDTNTAASGAIRRIFSGNTTDDASLSLTTTDTYFETAIFTDTIGNINASEMGFNKLATGGVRTVTVEEMWMMVDYTLGPITLMGQIWM